jgi:hypothetical protein
MYDYMMIQAEVDFRRERLSRSTARSMARRRSRKQVDGTRIPFVGSEAGAHESGRRAR